MLTPDHHTTKLGSKDFVFQVNKWPFSITCNPTLPVITESYIDLSLVKDMKIAMKKVECRHISYAGYSTKLVGSINQTVQVFYNGLPSGTMHLKAKVVRNLSTIYGVDCIASKKLYQTLLIISPKKLLMIFPRHPVMLLRIQTPGVTTLQTSLFTMVMIRPKL